MPYTKRYKTLIYVWRFLQNKEVWAKVVSLKKKIGT